MATCWWIRQSAGGGECSGRACIRERLARRPRNAGWQRDLVVSYIKIGDVLVDQGNLPEAVKSFRDGLAIRERLAQADPATPAGSAICRCLTRRSAMWGRAGRPCGRAENPTATVCYL